MCGDFTLEDNALGQRLSASVLQRSFEVAYNMNGLFIIFESKQCLQFRQLQYASDEDMLCRMFDAVERCKVDIRYVDFRHSEQISKGFFDIINLAESYFNNTDKDKFAAF